MSTAPTRFAADDVADTLNYRAERDQAAAAGLHLAADRLTSRLFPVGPSSGHTQADKIRRLLEVTAFTLAASADRCGAAAVAAAASQVGPDGRLAP